jgi:cytochrome P450
LTPSGEKRIPTSWAPFAGGKRVCFGKTFAEENLKFVVTYLSQHFNFELVNKKYETELPMAHFGQSRVNKIEVILTKNI